MADTISDDQLVWRVDIARLRQIACPLETPPWEGGETLRPEMVASALARNDLLSVPARGPACVRDHARRIAHLVRFGWHDPISIDVGVPWLPGWRPVWPIEDGNHRLYAAILRQDDTIAAGIGGCLSTARELLGTPLEQLK